MGLPEKSDENVRVAKKCLEMKTYNAGISRAYYAAFQRVENALKSSKVFDYEGFLKTNKIDVDHIPHGKMQQAMTKFLLSENKKGSLAKVTIYDNLYRKRRKADYSDKMLSESDLKQCLNEMEIIMSLVA
jgi:uncharacterized protein (UPF0332 family)